MLIVDANIRVAFGELKFSYARSSGPGGQNVNKVNTKAILRWAIYENHSVPYLVKTRFISLFQSKINAEGLVVISSDRFRDQKRNKQDCLDKLQSLLQKAARPPKKRRKTRPTKASKQRRLTSKKKLSEKKQGRRKDWGE